MREAALRGGPRWLAGMAFAVALLLPGCLSGTGDPQGTPSPDAGTSAGPTTDADAAPPATTAPPSRAPSNPRPTTTAEGTGEPAPDVDRPTLTSPTPRVVVAVADSGINPYHSIYYRPDLTQHPCTYVEGYDCDVPALELSIGVYDTWQKAFDADRAVWDSIELHQWYWIPRTNIIGAVCTQPEGGGPESVTAEPSICILDDSDMHGTGTTSSVLMEAPDALLLLMESNAGAEDLATAPVLPDIQSHSWGSAVPLPLHPLYMALNQPGVCGAGHHDARTLFFLAAGNEAPFPVLADGDRFCPWAIVVGGAYADQTEVQSWQGFDFASWFCRPTAQTRSLADYRQEYCGTSFSAPTAAGTAAAALLEIRRREGYTGGNTLEAVSRDVSRDQFLHALRMAATYDPAKTYANTGFLPAPPAGQEHLFWGWGFLDQQVVPAVVECAWQDQCPQKSATAVAWNEDRHALREQTWGLAP